MTTEKKALHDAIHALANLRALRDELRRVTGDTFLVGDMNDGSADWDAEVTP